MAEEDEELDPMLFLISCRAITEEMISKAEHNLGFMTEDQVHIRLLEDCYHGEAEGVQITQFMNAMATAVLIAAVERKKGKR